jgi:hypothetical protein
MQRLDQSTVISLIPRFTRIALFLLAYHQRKPFRSICVVVFGCLQFGGFLSPVFWFFWFFGVWFFCFPFLMPLERGTIQYVIHLLYAQIAFGRAYLRARSLSRATIVANPNHTPGIPFTQLLRYTQHNRRTRDNSTVHSTGGQNQLATKIC